jgi:hypothetical protein
VTEEHTSTENHGGKNQHAPLLLAQENWLAGEKPGEQNKNQSQQAQLVQRELRLATKRRNLAVKTSSMASAQNEQQVST